MRPLSLSQTRPGRRSRRSPIRPFLEALEDRTVPSTFLVTNTGDNGGVDPAPGAGTGTLRQAIVDADAQAPTASAIAFAIPTTDPGYDGTAFTIHPQSALPDVGSGVDIDGTSEPGYLGAAYTSPIIVLSGDQAGGGVSGLTLTGAYSTIQGLVVEDFSRDGIDITGPFTRGNVVEANFIGTDVTGTVAAPNGILGVEISGGAYNNTIGGDFTAARNIISGNTYGGVYITGSGTTGNVVAGDYIGTDVTGATTYDVTGIGALYSPAISGSGAGVTIDGGATDNTIGGDTAGARDVISGFGGSSAGVDIGGCGTSGNVVEGDYIGTDYTGTTRFDSNGRTLGNSQGVAFYDGATVNTVGGATASARNVISGNGQGVYIIDSCTSDNVVEGNFIGTDKTGTTSFDAHCLPLGNTTGVVISGGASGNTIGGAAGGAPNVISGNGLYGVDIDGSCGNVVGGNLIGTDVTGTTSFDVCANSLGNTTGVVIEGGASGNTIGGTTPAARNVIDGSFDSDNIQVPFGFGVLMQDSGTSGNVVEGNYIGLNEAGTTSFDSNGRSLHDLEGVGTAFGASGNTIGGAAAGAGNVISGGAVGVGIGTADNVVEGNDIGTDATGTKIVDACGRSLGNTLYGVEVAGSGNTIGGVVAGAGNVISGNAIDGVYIIASDNVVEGNFIGTDATGLPLPNNRDGVLISGGSSDSTIGGTTTGAGNVIAFNPFIGVQVDGANDNAFLGNSIHDNGFGIYIGDDGFQGGNDFQAAPVLTAGSSFAGETSISGTLASVANTAFRIEFFANQGLDASNAAEGQTFLGFATITTDANGYLASSPDGSAVITDPDTADASFMVAGLAPIPAGEVYVTATATVANADGTFGDTSPFSHYTTVTVLPPSSLSGLMFEDFNDDGQVDFGEPGIAGVTIALTGTDDLGDSVNQSQQTDSAGTYLFADLRPGQYYLTETQPAGYPQGIDTIGSAGGTLVAQDRFFIQLGAGVNGINYNYGEQPPPGSGVQKGQTAGIGFWQNKNGQALIKALNGGSTSTQLAQWLALTLPNMYGASAGAHSLVNPDGSYFTNAQVAAFFQSLFSQKGPKLDAQVLATALSVYITNATLDPTEAAVKYGFTVSGNGVGTATVNVGSDGAAFGVANNATLTVMDLLLAADQQAVNGLLYNGDSTLRNEANDLFSAVNEAGDIN
ncbi:MAG TPA: SdrD B-like domain-containing protein [Gemmataceae bacterium]|nr:SdrD B-like domain-containing protein [Gemmataceae bacterium]